MEIRLGKAQLVKAIDDGGISMYFRRDPSSSQLSRRVVLSVEVSLITAILIIAGKTEKTPKTRRRYRKSSCRSNIRRNARSSVSSRILQRNGRQISRGTPPLCSTENIPLFFILDMRTFTYSTRNYQINISHAFHNMVQNMPNSSLRKKFDYVNLDHT
jgi:hypothetical protein